MNQKCFATDSYAQLIGKLVSLHSKDFPLIEFTAKIVDGLDNGRTSRMRQLWFEMNAICTSIGLHWIEISIDWTCNLDWNQVFWLKSEKRHFFGEEMVSESDRLSHSHALRSSFRIRFSLGTFDNCTQWVSFQSTDPAFEQMRIWREAYTHHLGSLSPACFRMGACMSNSDKWETDNRHFVLIDRSLIL